MHKRQTHVASQSTNRKNSVKSHKKKRKKITKKSKNFNKIRVEPIVVFGLICFNEIVMFHGKVSPSFNQRFVIEERAEKKTEKKKKKKVKIG